ncbi:unnamed protein product [Caenorhabditis bovis]|uniref:Uncharacterized protein n=1 Tax=Caenorhabditis bovis TaxID=2654633 RepID=A0A8S1FAT6_9PELO|nr:unnamed protein product [Caenorhabditis bovis]CAB3410987.1 unnamed protein product [Caenorhabditis bovis]
MNCLKGFIVWILLSIIFISCYSKSIPIKRRMVLRLPFVQNGENTTNTYQQRTFLRMLNGNSKMMKKNEPSDARNWLRYVYRNRRA